MLKWPPQWVYQMNPHFIDELVARLEAENTQSAQPTRNNDARQEMRQKNAEALRLLGIK